MFMAEKQPRISMADINEAISRRDLARAEHMAGMLCHEHPKDIDVWLTRARIAQMRADHKSMLDMAKAAMAISPDHVQARFITAEACIHLGEIKMAAALLKDLQSDCWQDADALVRLSEAWTQCGRFEQAVTCLKRALDLEPENADIRYHYASALIAVGRLEQAETEYDRVIAINPHDYDAWYNRAGLRRQTPKNNHIDAIRALLAAPLKHPMGHVQLNYALAKELEDIGKYEESFKALKTGADARRRMLSYKVETDTKAMEAIKATFDADFFRRDHTACMSPAPIFIVGYPRSGTTLLDRILSAHS
ncbi:MAG TPA: tetratricopeptide repeat protein, partial [Hellea balneolensis]|nr:tetratricopeptide repeat protein [Hellea balneolensis]